MWPAIVIEDALHRELGWEVEELSRVWQTRDGLDEEIDAFGRAYDPSRPDTALWIVGEVKFNLTMRDLDRFSKLVARCRLTFGTVKSFRSASVTGSDLQFRIEYSKVVTGL